MLEAGSLAAVDVGQATHLVLQHLDFRRPCDVADLSAQLAELVERKLITPAQARAIDVDALTWLAQSEAGELLRANAETLRRELPVYVAVQREGSTDPQDQVMLRGRVDVLIASSTDGPGDVLIDYKTDRVAPRDVPARAASYREQVDAYRHAIEAITGRPVARVLLVFLAARVVHPM